MTDYLIVKFLHVLSATFLFGTGVGTAFYLLFASLSGNVQAVATVARLVVIADWLFTGTTIVFQPLSGLWLADRIGFSLGTPWLRWSLILWGLGLLCWLPVVGLQLRLRKLAQAAAAAGEDALPPAYWRCLKGWIALGIPAFFAFLTVFYLMVAKPA